MVLPISTTSKFPQISLGNGQHCMGLNFATKCHRCQIPGSQRVFFLMPPVSSGSSCAHISSSAKGFPPPRREPEYIDFSSHGPKERKRERKTG